MTATRLADAGAPLAASAGIRDTCPAPQLTRVAPARSRMRRTSPSALVLVLASCVSPRVDEGQRGPVLVVLRHEPAGVVADLVADVMRSRGPLCGSRFVAAVPGTNSLAVNTGAEELSEILDLVARLDVVQKVDPEPILQGCVMWMPGATNRTVPYLPEATRDDPAPVRRPAAR